MMVKNETPKMNKLLIAVAVIGLGLAAFSFAKSGKPEPLTSQAKIDLER